MDVFNRRTSSGQGSPGQGASAPVYSRPKNRRFMVLGDSRGVQGMPRGDQPVTVVKDRGALNTGFQFWAQFYSKGAMTFDEADCFGVANSPSRSYPGASAGTPPAMGMVDYQLPLALANSTAGNAIIICSTNDLTVGGGNGTTLWTGPQSYANILETITALQAKGIHVYVLTEYPKGNPSFSPSAVPDYGIDRAIYSSPGSGYALGDVITLQRSGITAAKDPKVKASYVTAGGAYAVTVVEPGAFASSNAAVPTNWTQKATTGAGTGAVFTIVEGTGQGAQALNYVHERLNALQSPNVFPVDVWPDLLVSRDSLFIDVSVSADGVHLNSTGARLVGRRLWEAAQVNLPPAPRPRGARQKYDALVNTGGNLLPVGTELSGGLQTGTPTIANFQAGSAASPQPAVTGNLPNAAGFTAPATALAAGVNTLLQNAGSPAIAFAQAADDPSWFEVRLTGTSGGSGGNGGSFRLLLNGATASPLNPAAVYQKVSAGDQVRASAECRIKRGSVGLMGVRLSLIENRPSSPAGYYGEHAGYPGAVGIAAGQGVYSAPWDSWLAGTGYEEGLLRTGILPIEGGQSFNLFCLQIDVNSSSAYDVTVGFRNWAIFKEV